jgi:hypothetical protein
MATSEIRPVKLVESFYQAATPMALPRRTSPAATDSITLDEAPPPPPVDMAVAAASLCMESPASSAQVVAPTVPQTVPALAEQERADASASRPSAVAGFAAKRLGPLVVRITIGSVTKSDALPAASPLRVPALEGDENEAPSARLLANMPSAAPQRVGLAALDRNVVLPGRRAPATAVRGKPSAVPSRESMVAEAKRSLAPASMAQPTAAAATGASADGGRKRHRAPDEEHLDAGGLELLANAMEIEVGMIMRILNVSRYVPVQGRGRK